jgi:membrane-associated phospholipid phosphatase
MIVYPKTDFIGRPSPWNKFFMMNIRLQLLVVSVLLLPFVSIAQVDTLIKKLDSLNKKADTAAQVNTIKQEAYNANTKITAPVYFILLASDLKQEITAPFHFTKREWIKAGVITLAGAILLMTDEPVQRFALGLRNRNKPVADIGNFVTRFGGVYEVYTLGSLGAFGYIFKNEKMKTTTLLATQAYLTGGAMQFVLKFLAGRQRPTYYDPTAIETEPKFHGPFFKGKDANGKRINSAFPSGHTAVAFAAATVFAMEYKDRPFVPVFSYTIATLIGLSRITENKHWMTDIFAGAVLGYFTGRQVVNNYHRYAKLKEAGKRKGNISFNMQYNYNQLEPGLTYHFR